MAFARFWSVPALRYILVPSHYPSLVLVPSPPPLRLQVRSTLSRTILPGLNDIRVTFGCATGVPEHKQKQKHKKHRVINQDDITLTQRQRQADYNFGDLSLGNYNALLCTSPVRLYEREVNRHRIVRYLRAFEVFSSDLMPLLAMVQCDSFLGVRVFYVHVFLGRY